MGTKIYPQLFNAGVPQRINWSAQIEKGLTGSRRYAASAKSNGVEIKPVLPKDGNLVDKLIHFITPTMFVREGELTRQTDLNAFFNRREDDLSTMPSDNTVLVCKVELTEKANDLMGGINVIFFLVIGALVGINHLFQLFAPSLNSILSQLAFPIIGFSFIAVFGYWGYAFDVQHRELQRYGELLRKTINAEVGTYFWTGERPN